MGRRRQVSDREISVAAREVFLDRGPKAPVAMVAKKLGVSTATLFQRTGSKQQLMLMAFQPDSTLVTELGGFNLAYLHVIEEDGAPESGPRFDIGGLRNLWNGPYIVNGNYDYSRAMKAIADGRADFVSFGKLFLANPDLPLRFARSAPLNVPDRSSFYGGDDRGYIDYPFLEEPLPALRRLILAAGGRAEHLACNDGRSTSSPCC